MGSLFPTYKEDHAEYYWNQQAGYHRTLDEINDNKEEVSAFGETTPSISEFNILISNSVDSDTTSISKNDFRFSTLNTNNYYRTRSNSIYELPIENCFFTAKQNHSARTSYAKKSVRFSDDTIFIERDMDSAFWKEFTDRKIRRRKLREQRREKRQQRSMTLFDLMRVMFSSPASKKPNHVKKITSQQNLTDQENILSSTPTGEDFNSNTTFLVKSSNARISQEDVDDLEIMPVEFGPSGRKNSKVNKILRSMQLWWAGSSGSQQVPSITSIQQLQIN